MQLDQITEALLREGSSLRIHHHHHHHASLLKIINKTGSLFRGLGALRLFSLSLSLSLSLLLSSYAVYVPFTAVAHWCPLR